MTANPVSNNDYYQSIEKILKYICIFMLVGLFDCAKINKLVYTSFFSPTSTLGKLPVSLHEYLPSQ